MTSYDFDRPDFVNDEGVKWWADKSATDYAKTRGVEAQVWLTELPNGYRSYLIVKDGLPIFEAQQIEAVGAHIDIMCLQSEGAS